MAVVMIPKDGKDLSKAKEWRPVVLIKCLLKLMDKVVANELQQMNNLLHNGQFGSRRGKAAIEMVIQATTEAQLEMTKGRCAWALGDIKSAFNYTRKSTVLDRRILQKTTRTRSIEGLTRYIQCFYQPRTAGLTWDGETRAATTIKSGIP